MISNKVKLVVWDLDETFWRGTLGEQGITAVAENIETVIKLSKRGIINSICSKNDPGEARAKLAEMGVLDYFVFPSISYSPKGKAVAEMIERAALRAENVLFLDDNTMNIEEVKYFNPGIMACRLADIDATGGLLAHPHLVGKPDPALTRLNQYRFLERKAEQRSASELSNEEFLRASNIRVTIGNDIEADFDRILELINRTNQLNFTKIRLETAEAVDDFRKALGAFGYQAGSVRAVDNYGDYGLVGFYLVHRRAHENRLVHFVFSCRTMHMGIEQYVYEMLGRPDIEIVRPVSCGLDSPAFVDWINVSHSGEGPAIATGSRKLLLLGACELMQLASYCSTNRVEFVNRVEKDSKIRYDDPGFVLSDRGIVQRSRSITKIPCWTYDDAVRFDEAVASSELMLISMWQAMRGNYYRTKDGVLLHFPTQLVKRLETNYRRWFRVQAEALSLSDADRFGLIAQSLDAIAGRSRAGAAIFVFGSYSLSETSDEGRARRRAYNDEMRKYCARRAGQFQFVDIDAIVPVEWVINKAHFRREGYFALARHILGMMASPDYEGDSALDAA